VFTLTSDGDAAHIEVFDPGSRESLGRVAIDGGMARAEFAADGRVFAIAAGGRTDVYELLRPRAAAWAAWAPHPVRAFGFRGDGRELATVASAAGGPSVGEAATNEFSTWQLPVAASPSSRWHLG
jgi:hypothetical protein